MKARILLLALAGLSVGPTHSTGAFRSVDTGGFHTCGVTTQGQVKCWGYFPYDNLGGMDDVRNAVSISSGAYHSCAILTDKTVRCWGDLAGWEVGDSHRPLPTVPLDLGPVESIATGYFQTCAVHASGDITCWGMGRPLSHFSFERAKTYYPAGTFENAESISLAGYGSGGCAVRRDKTVGCWDLIGPPAEINHDVRQVSVSSDSDCLLTSDGVVKCWRDTTARDGSHHTEVAPYPGELPPVASLQGSCALLVDGNVRCWNGRTGLGIPGPTYEVTGIEKLQSLSPGYYHSCGITARDGTVLCWGDNSLGQVVDYRDLKLRGFSSESGTGAAFCGLVDDTTARCWQGGPGYFRFPGKVISLAYMSREVLCGLLDTGEIACNWGEKILSAWNDPERPRKKIKSFVSTDENRCFLFEDGTAWCDRGSYLKYAVSVLIPGGIAEIQSPSDGKGRSCVLEANGKLSCFDSRPGSFLEWTGIERFSIGPAGVCAILRQDHSLRCKLNNGTDQTLAGKFTQVSVGGNHFCALDQRGAPHCGGENPDYIPKPPQSLRPLRTLKSSGFATCGIDDRGATVCWGKQFDRPGDFGLDYRY